MNTITSNGNARDFILVKPAVTDPGEKLPVLFMWHWIGGSAQGFVDKGEVQAAVDDQHFIAVVPVAKGATVIGTSFNTRWPFDISQTQGRMNEEFKFFDDMLACVEQQLPVGDTIIRPWNGAARKLPGVVLWGGDGPPAMDGNKDILGCLGIGMDFSVASNALEDGLEAGGHFFVECRHNCGHVEPPLDPPPGESKYAGLWEFALNHPYWLPAGTSPWQDGLPDAMPSWCAIGAGNSVPRSGGGCPEAENPCAY